VLLTSGIPEQLY